MAHQGRQVQEELLEGQAHLVPLDRLALVLLAQLDPVDHPDQLELKEQLVALAHQVQVGQLELG